ncbi:hypothetical protein [Phytohabitans houttuyneae]|uniref:hypothetical protein n=1 Tax=Phytohabitans houttuyneae TaxID=1076126 RepID=UPI00280AE5A9|nr:hypothetical protein [Phytohabitans houttuyneae]
MGHRTADICYHGLLTLAHLEGATLAQLPRLLSDAAWRTARVDAVTSALNAWEGNTLGEFWEGFNDLPAAQRSGLVAPLLSRLRLVLAHPMANSLFGVPATTFSFADILDGGVLLARLPKGVIGEDGTRLVGSLLLAGLWQATTARARIPKTTAPMHPSFSMNVITSCTCRSGLMTPSPKPAACTPASCLRTSTSGSCPGRWPRRSTPTPATRSTSPSPRATPQHRPGNCARISMTGT